MSAASDYLEDALLNHVFRNTAMTSPTTVYAALFTANTGLESNSPSAEVSGGSYARVSVTFNAPSGGVVDNSGAITFPEATGSWGTVTHVAVMDASSAGNVLVWGALSASRDIQSGDTFEIATGDLDVSLD
jgi:hypothetical protein